MCFFLGHLQYDAAGVCMLFRFLIDLDILSRSGSVTLYRRVAFLVDSSIDGKEEHQRLFERVAFSGRLQGRDLLTECVVAL